MTKEKLIVALDFPTLKEAQNCVEACGDEVCYYKVGMELYYSAGHEIISFLKAHHKKIFLDLKKSPLSRIKTLFSLEKFCIFSRCLSSIPLMQ